MAVTRALSLADEIDHPRNALVRAHVSEDEGPLTAHQLGVALHDTQIGADHRRRSVLMITTRSERVIGLPFLGIVSPAATSMT